MRNDLPHGEKQKLNNWQGFEGVISGIIQVAAINYYLVSPDLINRGFDGRTAYGRLSGVFSLMQGVADNY